MAPLPYRGDETERLAIGQRVNCNGYPGAVRRLYADGDTEAGRMYEVQLERGQVCVCGSDLIPE